MAKIKQDAEYEQVQKQYAELLARVNPKGSDEELEQLRKRIQERRWGQQPGIYSFMNSPIYNEMYKEEIEKEREELKQKWQELSAEKSVIVEAE